MLGAAAAAAAGGGAGFYSAPLNPAGLSRHRGGAAIQPRPAPSQQGFFRRQWRLIGLVIFALGAFGGILGTLDPDETRGETHLGNFGAFVLCTGLTVLFWYLYRTHRDCRTR